MTEPVAQCPETSPTYGVRCAYPAGHAGRHESADRVWWGQDEPAAEPEPELRSYTVEVMLGTQHVEVVAADEDAALNAAAEELRDTAEDLLAAGTWSVYDHGPADSEEGAVTPSAGL